MFLYIYSVIQGIVQGITELLPVSSTAHMILADRLFEALGFPAPGEDTVFGKMFFILIQLGSILAFLVYFHNKLLPRKASFDAAIRKRTLLIWLKAAVGVLPILAAGACFGSRLQETLYNIPVISASLFAGGIVLIVIESVNRDRKPAVVEIEELSFAKAFAIGIFQCLALIPGVSRSAATIIGALVLGTSRPLAVEYSFFLAIPTMLAAGGYGLLKYSSGMTPAQWAVTGIGFMTAFAVSYVIVWMFMKYIRTNDFKVFGWYRIVLGAILFGCLLLGWL